MTTWQAILLFTAAAGVMTITPGLDTALVLRTAVAEGGRRAFLAGLGVSCGVLTWGILASIGLGAVLAVSQLAYDILRIAGAVYLLYLGIRLIWRPRKTVQRVAGDDGPRMESGQRWFMRGLFTNLLNPKVGVFYVTFLPQFIPAEVNVIAFSALLAGIHAVQGTAWFTGLILATRPLARFLARPAVLTWLDRVTGGIFILFGVRLAFEQRN